MTAAMTSNILSSFGLQHHEEMLAKLLRATDSTIHGSLSLDWYLNRTPDIFTDIEIWCQPTTEFSEEFIMNKFNDIFIDAGYTLTELNDCDCGGGIICNNCAKDIYTKTPACNISNIYIWEQPGKYSKIKLIIRKTYTTEGEVIPKLPLIELEDGNPLIWIAPHEYEDRLVSKISESVSFERINAYIKQIRFMNKMYLNINNELLKYLLNQHPG